MSNVASLGDVMDFHWNIARRLTALTAIMLTILIATSGFGIHGLSRMHDSFNGVAQDTTKALSDLSGVVDALHRIRIRTVSATVERDSAKVAALRDEFKKQMSDLDKAWVAALQAQGFHGVGVAVLSGGEGLLAVSHDLVVVEGPAHDRRGLGAVLTRPAAPLFLHLDRRRDPDVGVRHGFVEMEGDGDQIGPELTLEEIDGCRLPGREPFLIPVAVPAAMAIATEIGVGGGDQQLAGDDLAGLRLQADGGQARPHVVNDVAGADQHLVEMASGRVDVVAQPGHGGIPDGVLRGLAQFPQGVCFLPMSQDAEDRPAATAFVVVVRHDALPAKSPRRRHRAKNRKGKGEKAEKRQLA